MTSRTSLSSSSSSSSPTSNRKKGIIGGLSEDHLRHRHSLVVVDYQKIEEAENDEMGNSDHTDVTTTPYTFTEEGDLNVNTPYFMSTSTTAAATASAGGDMDAFEMTPQTQIKTTTSKNFSFSLNEVVNDDKLTPLELEMQPLRHSSGLQSDEGDANDSGDLHLQGKDTHMNGGGTIQKMHYTSCQDDKDSSYRKNWRDVVEDWLYPPDQPRSCQLLRLENIAVPACYLLVGLLQGLSAPLINVLPLDLGASEAQQTTVSSIRSLPASLKLLFGFWSDNVPMFGYRRKPYMLIGWFLASVSMLALPLLSNLSAVAPRNKGCFTSAAANATETENDADDVIAAASAIISVPSDAPSIPFLSICLLGFGMGFWLADVMGDSIVAEKAKLEPEATRGSIQSSCYSYRFFGMMIAAPASTYLYAAYGPAVVVSLLALLPLCILPLIYMLAETPNLTVPSTRDQCGEIWNTVCSRAVWQPMGFVYLYNLMQVGNSAWKEYLVTVWHFTNCHLNFILITAYVLLYAGIVCYKYCFMDWSWRKVYIFTTILNGFFSALQLLLITGNIPAGLSPYWFALGDEAMSEFISGIQFLPTTIMMVHLCPAGSEGASYAMFTTVNNSALTLASAISTMLLGIWNVSREALAAGQLQGMINLTYLTTACQVAAVFLVGWLPHYKSELTALRNDNSQNSKLGGAIFLFITAGSILYAVGIGLLNIMAPGWMGES